MKLPKLLLDANIGSSIELYDRLSIGRVALTVDASDLLAIEPVAACLIASGVHRHVELGGTLTILNASSRVRQLVERLNCRIILGDAVDTTPQLEPQAPTLAREVRVARDANSAANQLAEHIASFVPSDMRAALREDEFGARIHHAVQPALAYVLAELLDNVFSHALSNDYPNPIAWVAAQYYPTGDLMRVAVVDNGCGLLGSLGALDPAPKSHFEAADMAFTPFVTSKGRRMLYADRQHMGIGLSVCKEICGRLNGRIYSASGDAQLVNPGSTRFEERNRISFYQGTVVSLEFHREAATNQTLQQALEKCVPKPSVDVRFD